MVSRPDPSCLNVERHADRAVVRIAAAHFGAVDDEPAGERLIAALDEGESRLLVLDFANVNFMSSIGLAILLRLHKRLSVSGRRLALQNLQPHLYELFSVTRLNTVFDVREQGAA